MKYKIIFFDIDGTIYSHQSKSIPESTIKSLKELKEKGYIICVASGRSKKLTSLTGIFNYIDFDYLVLTNGTLVEDNQGNIIYSAPLDKDAINTLLDIVNKHYLNVTFVNKNDYYLFNDNYALAHLGYDPLSIALPSINQYQKENIYQINLFCEDKYLPLFNSCFDVLEFSRLQDFGYDVYTKNHNKSVGIKALLQYLNISPSEAIAFGDGHNDKEMIEYVELGIAMGNAIDKVKNAANYVTSDIDNDGIYNALKHFNII